LDAPDKVSRLFPPTVRSLKVLRTVIAYTQPDDKSRARGMIAPGTRVGFLRAQEGRGCQGTNRFIEVEEDAWVCDRHLEPSPLEPGGEEFPKLPPGNLVQGQFAVIDLPKKEKKEGAFPVGYKSIKDIRQEQGVPTGGAWKCMLLEEEKQKPIVFKGRKYVRTDCNGFIFPMSFVRKLTPSSFEGVKLSEAGLELPIVFVSQPGAETKSAPSGGKKVRFVKGRTVLKVYEIKVLHSRGPDKPPARAYRVGEREWLPSWRGNLAEKSPPPKGLLPGERWVDVNTDEQVLVAYEGETPVFATLVSTGKEHPPEGKEPTPTEPGVYRIYHKLAETKMSGLEGTDEAYWVSRVPWTQYFAGDLALHGAYWHDGFGRMASHGCVNLAPKDARFLYGWTEPLVPPGWIVRAADTSHPGSLVRIRNAKEPKPEFKGYARRVLKLRLGKGQPEEKPGETTEAPAIPVEPGGSVRGTP